jgi:hypothetical protein
VHFLAKAVRHFPGSFTKFAHGFADVASHFRQPLGPKDKQGDNNNDHNMDGLDSEWHLKFLSPDKPGIGPYRFVPIRCADCVFLLGAHGLIPSLAFAAIKNAFYLYHKLKKEMGRLLYLVFLGCV